MMDTIKISKTKESFLNEIVKPIFPGAEYGYEFELMFENLFKKTKYEYFGDNKFLHFTSTQNLKSILESGYLRMSDFNNLVDNNELVYGLKVFNESITCENTNKTKSEVFCLSACKSEEETQKDLFMWKEYAKNGSGVSIEYVIDIPNSIHFTLGEIRYGKDGLKQLHDLRSVYENHPLKTDFNLHNFVQSNPVLMSFNKSKKFTSEKEVRLFFRYVKGNWLGIDFGDIIYKDINSNNDVRNFMKIFIKQKTKKLEEPLRSFVERSFPQIDIKRITLGFNLSNEQRVGLKNYFLELKQKHNYEFEIL